MGWTSDSSSSSSKHQSLLFLLFGCSSVAARRFQLVSLYSIQLSQCLQTFLFSFSAVLFCKLLADFHLGQLCFTNLIVFQWHWQFCRWLIHQLLHSFLFEHLFRFFLFLLNFRERVYFLAESIWFSLMINSWFYISSSFKRLSFSFSPFELHIRRMLYVKKLFCSIHSLIFRERNVCHRTKQSDSFFHYSFSAYKLLMEKPFFLAQHFHETKFKHS